MSPARRPSLADEALAAALGAGLFATAAVPWLFVRQPPLQDYAEHVAAARVAGHLADFPEDVFNGFFKTNSAFVTFAWLAGKAIGVEAAGRVFAVGVLAVNAFVLPRFVLRFGGRARMRVAALFALPFVHDWFVSMGMLNFSLGASLSLLTLVALDRHAAAPSRARGHAWAAAAGRGDLVRACRAGAGRGVARRPPRRVAPESAAERREQARVLLPPLAPSAAAVVASTVVHLRGDRCGPRERAPPRPSRTRCGSSTTSGPTGPTATRSSR